MGDQVPEFVVLVLERVADGRTDEHHAEAQSLDEALVRVKEAHEKLPSWIAITIVHATDYPKVVEGAEHG